MTNLIGKTRQIGGTLYLKINKDIVDAYSLKDDTLYKYGIFGPVESPTPVNKSSITNGTVVCPACDGENIVFEDDNQNGFVECNICDNVIEINTDEKGGAEND